MGSVVTGQQRLWKVSAYQCSEPRLAPKRGARTWGTQEYFSEGLGQQASLLRAALIVRGLDAGSATGPLGYALPILRLGFSTFGGLSGSDSVRIGVCHSSIAGAMVDRSGAVGPLSCTNSTVAGRSGFYTGGILLDDGGIAGVRIDCDGSIPIATNGFATAILDAVAREQTGSEKEARYQHNILHWQLR